MSPAVRSVLVLNALVLVGLLFALGVGVGTGASLATLINTLFLRPAAPDGFSIGALTHVFQMLCVVPPTLLFFTLVLGPRSDDDAFLLSSGLLTGAFLLNEVFRLHVHLMTLGIGKLVVVAVAAVVLLGYGIVFRARLRSGTDAFAIVGFTTLIVGVVIDSLKLSDESLTDALEGVPKVISQVNLIAYFYLVCRAVIRRRPPQA